MHAEPTRPASPHWLALAVAQLLGAALVLALLVRAIVDDPAGADIAARVGIAAAVGIGVTLHRRRLGARWSVAGSPAATVVFVAAVIGPAVVFVGLATGFVLDATTLQVLVVVTLAGVVVEAAVCATQRRQDQREDRP
ncbi:MAG TPA: hypothetical protein VGE77_11275 [Nocardioides sp.]